MQRGSLRRGEHPRWRYHDDKFSNSSPPRENPQVSPFYVRASLLSHARCVFTAEGKISSYISERHVFFHAGPPTSKTASHDHACHPLDATGSRDIRFTWVHPEDPPTTADLRAPTRPPNSPAPNPIKHSWDVTDQIQPPHTQSPLEH